MVGAVRKAVFPVAGLGTRFLPATKVVAKELLPVVDRPLIQYAVDEAVEAGCETLIFVINRHKHAVADYFDRDLALEDQLLAAGNDELLDAVRNVVPPGVQTVFVTQPEALGLGHAVLCASAVVGDETFAVLLPDDLIHNRQRPGVLSQMIKRVQARGGSALAVETVSQERTRDYGIVTVESCHGSAGIVRSIIEKPLPSEAPSTMAVVGRYVLEPVIFDQLRTLGAGVGGEVQLSDAIAGLLPSRPVWACPLQGVRFDCGTPAGLIEATLRFALDNEKLSERVAAMMVRALDDLGVTKH